MLQLTSNRVVLRPGRGDALPGAGVPEWGGALHAARAEVAALQRHLPRAVRAPR